MTKETVLLFNLETELFLVGTLPRGLVFSGALNSLSRTHPSDGGVLVGACPTGKLVAFVTPNYQAQFITGHTEPSDEVGSVPSFSYTNAFQGLLDIDREPMSTKPRPQATAVLVVPIAFYNRPGTVQRSSIILVGFSDGYVRGYSKSGQQVISQLMHTEAVSQLTCMTSSSTQKANANQCNVVVLYPDHVCVVDGGSLVNVIKSYAQSKSSDVEEDEGAVFLSYKKWKILDQTSTADVALLGHSTPTAFDHLCEASTVAGFDATVRSSPTPEANLITVGESPMIALYKITKDAGHLNMSEVVHAVASKMKTAVMGRISQASGWLGWGKTASSPKPSPKEKIQLSSNLPMSTNIPDSRRTVASITVSPQGNLAAVVDCFGRVLLVECEGLVIRRMWKGYRDAQCGWLLVQDSPMPKKTERGKRRRPKTASLSNTKKAQCLCIYAPRRGIVELWPVQSGSRVAVFPVGKGCQLLYSPHDTFTFDPTEGARPDGNKEVGVANENGVRDTVLLLCPDGQLVTFSVPFPLLTRLGDPTSFDAHLMKKLPQALQSSDNELLVQVFSGLKSSQSMKQAMDILIGAHHTQNISYDVIIKLLNISMDRINRMDPATYPLYRYVGGVKQGVELLQGVEEIVISERTYNNKLDESLKTACGIPTDRATTISSCLKNYFSAVSQRKTVVKCIDLKGFIKCFELPTKVGNILLSSSKPAGEEGETEKITRSLSRSYSSLPVSLSLKDNLSSSTLLDVGSTLFLTLLTKDVTDYSLPGLFQSCGVPARELLSLLCRLFLSALPTERNPTVLLQRLYKLVTLISAIPNTKSSSSLTGSTKHPDSSEADLWTSVCLQCAQSHNVGHALMMVLLCQRFASTGGEDMDTSEQDWESWEPVTSEKEQWISLTHHLEVLTLVSNVIGRDALASLPPAPYAICDEEVGGAIDIHDLQPLQQSLPEGVCASTLEVYGSGLIAHCLCRWLVHSHIPAEFVARIPSDPHDNVDSKYSRLVFQLSPLLKLLPQTLCHESLLVHCAWQAACNRTMDPTAALEFVSHIDNINTVRGMVGVLWHCVYESWVVGVIDSLKRGSSQDDRCAGVLFVCRNLFSWLYKLSIVTEEPSSEDVTVVSKDLLLISNPPERVSLMELVGRFPRLNPTVTKTYLELLLLTEISLKRTSSVNLTTLFPTWLRGALKKGAYKSAWQEQVPVQLQQKRTKHLCEAVGLYMETTGPPKIPPTLASVALSQLSSSSLVEAVSLEVADFKDIVFLLVDLWGLDGDTVRKQWVCAFFAAGLGDKGKEMFLGIKDKSKVTQDLVSLSGSLTDHLLQSMDNKAQKLALMAQVSPSLIEWLRNQGKRPMLKVCTRLEPDWLCVSQLLSLIQPYITARTSLASIMTALSQLVQKCNTDL